MHTHIYTLVCVIAFNRVDNTAALQALGLEPHVVGLVASDLVLLASGLEP